MIFYFIMRSNLIYRAYIMGNMYSFIFPRIDIHEIYIYPLFSEFVVYYTFTYNIIECYLNKNTRKFYTN